MRILYVHGLSSSGASSTVGNLKRLLSVEDTVIAPDLPIDPKKAVELLSQICKKEQPDIIVGTSMGGMFAQKLRGYPKLLINPAFHVSGFMKNNIGILPFLNPRKDGVSQFEITEQLCADYEQLETTQFMNLDDFEKNNTFGLFGKYDMLVNCSNEFIQNYKFIRWFEGEHRLTTENIRQDVIPYIQDILRDRNLNSVKKQFTLHYG